MVIVSASISVIKIEESPVKVTVPLITMSESSSTFRSPTIAACSFATEEYVELPFPEILKSLSKILKSALWLLKITVAPSFTVIVVPDSIAELLTRIPAPFVIVTSKSAHGLFPPEVSEICNVPSETLTVPLKFESVSSIVINLKLPTPVFVNVIPVVLWLIL